MFLAQTRWYMLNERTAGNVPAGELMKHLPYGGAMSIALSLAAAGALAQSGHKCTPLTFAADGRATVHEHIPDFIPLCYSFTARAGQSVTASITRDNKMSFSIVYNRPSDNLELAVADQEQTYHFTTDAQTYRVLLNSSLIHADTAAYFTLSVELK